MDKQRSAAWLSMMPLTQFGGQGKAVGALLVLLAALPVEQSSDEFPTSCMRSLIFTPSARHGSRWPKGMSTGAPWVLVENPTALNVILGMTVLWLSSARSSPGVPAVKPNESTKHVLGGGQTSTDPGVTLEWSLTWQQVATLQSTSGSPRRLGLMRCRVRFLQDIPEHEGITVGSCSLWTGVHVPSDQALAHDSISRAGPRGRPQRGVGTKTAE